MVVAIAIITLVVGPITHFISQNVVKAVVSVQQQQKGGTFFPSTIEENGVSTQPQIYKAQFKIDKSQFKKAPEFTQITGYLILLDQ